MLHTDACAFFSIMSENWKLDRLCDHCLRLHRSIVRVNIVDVYVFRLEPDEQVRFWRGQARNLCLISLATYLLWHLLIRLEDFEAILVFFVLWFIIHGNLIEQVIVVWDGLDAEDFSVREICELQRRLVTSVFLCPSLNEGMTLCLWVSVLLACVKLSVCQNLMKSLVELLFNLWGAFCAVLKIIQAFILGYLALF